MSILDQIKQLFGGKKPVADVKTDASAEVVIEKKPVADEEMLKRIFREHSVDYKRCFRKTSGC
jgi:hypothetical protein